MCLAPLAHALVAHALLERDLLPVRALLREGAAAGGGHPRQLPLREVSAHCAGYHCELLAHCHPPIDRSPCIDRLPTPLSGPPFPSSNYDIRS